MVFRRRMNTLVAEQIISFELQYVVSPKRILYIWIIIIAFIATQGIDYPFPKHSLFLSLDLVNSLIEINSLIGSVEPEVYKQTWVSEW
jgi:hypothetical protein